MRTRILQVFLLFVTVYAIFAYTPASAATICSDANVPDGYAVIAVAPNGSCTTNIAYTVEPFSSNQQICAANGVPAGSVVTQVRVNSVTCYNFLQYTVQEPFDGQVVCAAGSVPSGYVVTSATANLATCSNSLQYRIAQAANGQAVCAAGGVPSGYVVTSATANLATCNNSLQYRIALPSDGQLVCAAGSVPSGYVVTSSSVNPNVCSTFLQYRIAVPNSGQLVCAAGKVPTGYVVTSVSANPNSCADTLQYLIQQPSNGNTVCAVGGARGVPTGYVVTAIGINSSQCHNFITYNIANPNGNSITMCSVTDAPAGYRINSVLGTTSACSNALYVYTTYQIVPLSQKPIATFVNSKPPRQQIYRPIPANITFDASGSYDPDGMPLSYRWDFGDGFTETTNVPVIAHTFSTNYTAVSVQLTVNDGTLSSDPYSAYIVLRVTERPTGK